MTAFGRMNTRNSERGRAVLRIFDRLAGIPFVWCVGKLRSKGRFDSAAVTKIGILACPAIGDTTLLGAVLQDLRTRYPTAHIVFFAGSSNAGLARLLGVTDEVVDLPLTQPLRALRVLRRFEFDLLIDFGQWPRINALLACFSRARYTVGFNAARQYRHYAYDEFVDYSDTQHELENFRRLARAVDANASHPPAVPDAVGASVTLPGRLAEEPYVVFHLWPSGYRSYLKEWPSENWIRLGRAISAMGYKIVLTGAPTDYRRNGAVVARAAVESHGRHWVNLAGCKLDETIGILRKSCVTVSVNTGVMHLAAVIGANVIGLHGPTSARRWGPIGSRAIAVSAPGEDCGYLNIGFEYPRHCDCMHRITVDHVLERCREALDRASSEADGPKAILAEKRTARLSAA